MMPAQVIAATMMSITSIGGVPGFRPKQNTISASAKPQMAPSAKPPCRDPSHSANSISTKRMSINIIYDWTIYDFDLLNHYKSWDEGVVGSAEAGIVLEGERILRLEEVLVVSGVVTQGYCAFCAGYIEIEQAVQR